MLESEDVSVAIVAGVAVSNFIIRLVIQIRLNATLHVVQVASAHDGGECVHRHSYTVCLGCDNRAAVWITVLAKLTRKNSEV